MRIDSVGKATLERLNRYSWPGNVRELENVLERAVILSNGPTLEIDLDVFASATAARSVSTGPPTTSGSEGTGQAGAAAGPSLPLESLESSMRNHILAVLEQSRWVIDGPARRSEGPGPAPEHAPQPDEKNLASSARTKASHDDDSTLSLKIWCAVRGEPIQPQARRWALRSHRPKHRMARVPADGP